MKITERDRYVFGQILLALSRPVGDPLRGFDVIDRDEGAHNVARQELRAIERGGLWYAGGGEWVDGLCDAGAWPRSIALRIIQKNGYHGAELVAVRPVLARQ